MNFHRTAAIIVSVLLSLSFLTSCDEIDKIVGVFTENAEEKKPENVEFSADPLSVSDENERHDLVFDTFVTGLNDHKNSFTFPCSDELDCDWYCRILTEVLDSHKEFFRMTGMFNCTTTETETNIGKESYITIDAVSFLKSFDEEIEYENRFEEAANKILSSAPQFSDDYEKVLYIHDVLINTTEYDEECANMYSSSLDSLSADDFDYYQRSSAYGPIVTGSAMCLGYSSAFQYYMSKLGVECLCISGTGKNQRHSWNKVKVDGDWYNIDVTWDDQEKSSPSYRYFLIDDAEFSSDHTAFDTVDSDMEFVNLKNPACTAEKYDYHVYNGYLVDTYDFDTVSAKLKEQMMKNGFVTLKFSDPAVYDKALDDLFHYGKVYSIDGVGRSFNYYTDSYPILEMFK